MPKKSKWYGYIIPVGYVGFENESHVVYPTEEEYYEMLREEKENEEDDL
ncbi:MAG: hypothetical protein KBT27_09375 [Prevotellaceae bacterium]|nr:hypothetical protein [Candidatus Faecinaster equi]